MAQAAVPDLVAAMTFPTLVVAGTADQFDQWCREHKGERANAVYFTGEASVIGKRFSRVVRWGTWYERTDLYAVRYAEGSVAPE